MITNLPGELHAGGVHDAGIGQLDHIARQQAGACLAQVQAAVEIALSKRERESQGKLIDIDNYRTALTVPTAIGSDMGLGSDKPCEFSARIRKK